MRAYESWRALNCEAPRAVGSIAFTIDEQKFWYMPHNDDKWTDLSAAITIQKDKNPTFATIFELKKALKSIPTIYIPPLPEPPSTTLSRYTYVQSEPATTWNIQHNLGIWPLQCFAVDEDAVQIIGEVDDINSTPNLFILIFSDPVAGTAYLQG